MADISHIIHRMYYGKSMVEDEDHKMMSVFGWGEGQCHEIKDTVRMSMIRMLTTETSMRHNSATII